MLFRRTEERFFSRKHKRKKASGRAPLQRRWNSRRNGRRRLELQESESTPETPLAGRSPASLRRAGLTGSGGSAYRLPPRTWKLPSLARAAFDFRRGSEAGEQAASANRHAGRDFPCARDRARGLPPAGGGRRGHCLESGVPGDRAGAGGGPEAGLPAPELPGNGVPEAAAGRSTTRRLCCMCAEIQGFWTGTLSPSSGRDVRPLTGIK
jgi:hypothetical protein